MTQEKDYVLGTHDAELARLGLQHRVWRPRALDAWRRAGFTVGQTIVDVGCGPGYAALDLAEIVGATGQVVAVDRSKRFLDALSVNSTARGLTQVRCHELDLGESGLPVVGADGAWARWVFAFVRNPRQLLTRVAAALRPGASLVIHEYFDYATWRLAPRCAELEEFVQAVMKSWRADGGEPDIALDLLGWLPECGFEIRAKRSIIDVVSPSDFSWHWPMSFVQVGLKRLVDLGHVTAVKAQEIADALFARESSPHAQMFTPAVLEMIAVRV